MILKKNKKKTDINVINLEICPSLGISVKEYNCYLDIVNVFTLQTLNSDNTDTYLWMHTIHLSKGKMDTLNTPNCLNLNGENITGNTTMAYMYCFNSSFTNLKKNFDLVANKDFFLIRLKLSFNYYFSKFVGNKVPNWIYFYIPFIKDNEIPRFLKSLDVYKTTRFRCPSPHILKLCANTMTPYKTSLINICIYQTFFKLFKANQSISNLYIER